MAAFKLHIVLIAVLPSIVVAQSLDPELKLRMDAMASLRISAVVEPTKEAVDRLLQSDSSSVALLRVDVALGGTVLLSETDVVGRVRLKNIGLANFRDDALRVSLYRDTALTFEFELPARQLWQEQLDVGTYYAIARSHLGVALIRFEVDDSIKPLILNFRQSSPNSDQRELSLFKVPTKRP